MAFDNIRLEKELYTNGSFTENLERLDPSAQYKGTALEGLDAFQRQLKRFDIKVNGAGSDTVEKFFRTGESAVLFPEFVSRAVRTGLEGADVLPRITAAVTLVDSADYRSISSDPDDKARELRDVAEGAVIPETRVSVRSNLIRLHKRGRMIVASYEALRRQRLDLFTVTLRQTGSTIARSQLGDAVNVLINGDGNQNPAVVLNTAEAGKLAYSDLINLWSALEPYEMNTLLVSPDIMAKMLGMSEFRDSAAGLEFHSTGRMITPLGAQLIKCSAVPEGTIIGMDRSCALEMVKFGEVSTEYDKLIDRQLERAAITCTAGFAKIFDPAVKVMKV